MSDDKKEINSLLEEIHWGIDLLLRRKALMEVAENLTSIRFKMHIIKQGAILHDWEKVTLSYTYVMAASVLGLGDKKLLKKGMQQ